MARECLRHWRRTMRKKPHVSYLPMLVRRNVPPLPGPLPHRVAEREKSASENYVAPVALGRRLIQGNATEDSALKRHECRAPGRDACGPQKRGGGEGEEQSAGGPRSPAENSAMRRHECRDPKDGVAERKAPPFRHCAAEREARERSSQCGFSPSPIAKGVSGEFSLSWACPTSNNQKQL